MAQLSLAPAYRTACHPVYRYAVRAVSHPQAVQPFIDPVTKQKIVFVDKGPKEKDEMGAR